MIFGERIKQLRTERKWTQEYVCEKLNISSGALSRYETGMYEPKSLELIKDFADLFNVTTDYLLGKSDLRTPSQSDIPEIRQIERGAKKMSQKDKEKMVNMIKAAFEEAFNEDDNNK